jgi:hypothetical protein
LGHLVGRGALLSILLMVFLLPTILYLFDGPIMRGRKKHEERLQRLRERKIAKARLRRGDLNIFSRRRQPAGPENQTAEEGPNRSR